MNNSKVFLNEKIAKKLFKNEKYGKILSARVISDVIGADYNEVYDNIELSSEEIAFSAKTLNSTADAVYYYDIHYFNIELNFYKSDSKVKQLASYTYQLYLGQLSTHKDYDKIKKIIQISIDSYDYFEHNEFIYRVSFMEEKYHERESDDITKIHINLAYLNKLDYNNIVRSGNQLMKDLYFLTCNDNKKLNVVYEGDNLMKEIINKAKKIAGIMDLDLYMTDEELLKHDQERYYKKGIQEGMEKNKKEMVINLYNKKIPIDTIAECANLSIEEVQKIINKIE